MKKEVAKPAIIKLRGMIGKPFMYKSQNITILDYHVLGEEGATQIDVENGNGEPIPPIKTQNLNKFIELCLPVEVDDKVEETGISTEVQQQTSNLLLELQKTLKENIELVKKDVKYIKQASVVNSSVNSLIGLAKIQIQVMKMGKQKVSQ